MKRLVLLGSIMGSIAAFVAACLFVLATLAWLIRHWHPASWVIWVVGLSLAAGAVAGIYRWWRLPVERRFRFSLRGMLVSITLFALWFGLVGINVLRWGREGVAVVDMAGSGVEVEYYRGMDLGWDENFLVLGSYNPFVEVHDIDIRRDQGLPALLEHANDFHDLEYVNFWGGGITNAGLDRVEGLNQFPKLRTGLLYGCNVTDSGLERLTDCTRLKALHLHNCGKLTDTALAPLHELPNLEFLRLLQEGAGKMPITDAGMAHVADLQQLRELHMVCIPISDAGIAQLRNMPELEHVHLRETKVTEEGVRALCETLPDCFVTWDKASFPAVNQIREIEVWTKEPRERRIAVIGERERITAIKVWLDQYMQGSFNSGGWRREGRDGPAATSVSVRFEGHRRRLCEIGLGNGVYLSTWECYRPIPLADEKRIRALLGVDVADWNTSRIAD